MKSAIIGLVQSGKSTLFSAISGREAPLAGSANMEQAVVSVPDERIDWLSELYKPKKITYGTIDCLDVPGLSFTDDHGRAFARKQFNALRTLDLLVLVVRAFENNSVAPYKNRIDCVKDLDELKTELLLADLELVETRIEKLEKQVNKPGKTQAQDKAELAVQLKCRETIENGKAISSAVDNERDLAIIKSLGFLTLKPMVVAVNAGEDMTEVPSGIGEVAGEDIEVIKISAEIEKELSQLDKESRAEFMAELGITESAASKFVNSCYSTLGLISFLTSGPDEVRAWPIIDGTSAVEAAGKIHSDIQRGFIRAETIAYDDLHELGDEKAVKAAGKVRLEGKEYVVKDGDIINFRFNV
jgi:hypothetical protein